MLQLLAKPSANYYGGILFLIYMGLLLLRELSVSNVTKSTLLSKSPFVEICEGRAQTASFGFNTALICLLLPRGGMHKMQINGCG